MKLTMGKIEGLVAAPFSPLHTNGTINLNVIPKYAQFLIQNKVQGVFVNGTSGEGLSLTTEERKAVLAAWVKTTPKTFKVIAQIGHPSIEDSKALAVHAQEIGAYAVGSLAPIFFKPGSVEDLVAHCALEAAAAPKLPYYFYHIPQLTGVDFPMIDFLRLADVKIPNFAGIKYSKFELSDYRLCLDFKNGKYDIPFCQDETFVAAMSLGAKGSIGSTYNYDAPITLGIMKAFNEGRMKDAADLQLKAIQIVKCLVRTGCYFAGAKELMRMVGIDLGCVRSPLKNPDPEKFAIMKSELEKIDYAQFASK
jgi:N-acetylneuraminate lyase